MQSYERFNTFETEYFYLEPFSKREAFNWVVNKAKTNGFKISIRHLGAKWNWDKSKVSRFLKFLREEDIIETVIANGKTCVKLKPIMDSKDFSKHSRDKSETVLIQDAFSSHKNVHSNADCETLLLSHLTMVNSRVYGSFSGWLETISSQFQDLVLSEKKERRETKEKKQKKEKRRKEESLKEKSSLLERAKKEKEVDKRSEFSSQLTELESIELIGFAESIDLTKDELLWEKAKFEDYLRVSRWKPPKDLKAAFRNWLRRATEFIKTRRNYEQNNDKKPDKRSDYERFVDAGTRAVAKVERRRLERQYSRDMSIYLKCSSTNTKDFSYLRVVN